MILYIDTSEPKKVIVKLKKANNLTSIVKTNKPGSQILLPAIWEVLKKGKADLTDVKKIEVNTGPGSYTGLRVGISVANALGYALKLSVNDNPIGKLALPIYE